MGVRAFNVVLGFWLFMSSIVFTHDWHQLNNAWLVGTVVVTMALVGLAGVSWGRAVNAVAGGWLVLSTLLWPAPATFNFWNQLAIGALVAFFALQNPRDVHHPQHGPA
jgi:hypothetical protein